MSNFVPSLLCPSFHFLFLGDIERVGECLDKYWTHKKLMAHGCEPTSVKAMMERIKPYAYGNFSFLFFFFCFEITCKANTM